MADLKRLSKFLALALRHRSEAFGLKLDAGGYTDLNALWSQVQRRYPGQFTHQDLLLLLESEAGKQRYELQGGRIRALYGHSSVREIVYEPAVPPEVLYHGTTRPALAAIRQQGLTAQKRQYVHLSTGTERALNVAGRHAGDLVLLEVQALAAHQAGISFYHPEPQHYLAKAIPPEFIHFPDEPVR